MTAGREDIFDGHMQQWRAWASAPWGRIRFAVVRHTLARQVAGLGGGPLRVLDVGGGDGRDSVPLAEQGHRVTILDSSREMLQEADASAERAGVAERVRTVEGSIDEAGHLVGEGYDLVLCHFLLQYRPAGLEDLTVLASAVRDGGRVSVIAPNPAGSVLGRLVREGPAAALAELERETSRTTTFEHEVRKLDPEEMCAGLADVGLEVVARYGGRTANDLLGDDEAKHDPVYYSELERLEIALCDQEPFLRTGLFWQIVARRVTGDTRP